MRRSTTAAAATSTAAVGAPPVPAATVPTLQEVLSQQNADPALRLRYSSALAAAQDKVCGGGGSGARGVTEG